jgi:mono/diheme cytochrome c family protein
MRTMPRRPLLLAASAFAVVILFAGAKQRAVRPVAQPVTGPTFSREIVRIFQNNCQSCHHPGDIAPFSLMDYASAKPWADQIKLMTQTHQMPPWKPIAGCGDFANTRMISQADIDTIAKWVSSGAPEGNRADLPTPLDFSSGWTLGQPDLALAYKEKYTPPANGDMYRCFPLPTNLAADKYVSAIDIHPGDRKTVHHVIAFIDKTGASEALDAADPAPGYTCFGGPGFDINDPGAATLGGWAPGTIASRFPEEVAFSLPAGSRIVLQVHYHSHDGQPIADNTEIGVYYAKKQPQKRLLILPLINQSFTIPPNDSNYKVSAGFQTPPFPSVHLWAIYPHMHLLGRSMNVQMSPLGGKPECLINIDDWDFNWQGMYRYSNPIAISPLTKFSLEAHYDNSTGNMRNPNTPPKPVSWGEQTTDEMCIAFMAVSLDSENLATTGQVEANWIPAIPFPR